MGRRKKKCLANAVLACCRGQRWARMQKALMSRCDNDDGAGSFGQERERRNFEVVRKCLEEEKAFVRVLFVASRQECVTGAVRKEWWRLGAKDGACLGTLAWSTQEKHVYVVSGEGVRDIANHEVTLERCQAPWYGVVVGGAPQGDGGRHQPAPCSPWPGKLLACATEEEPGPAGPARWWQWAPRRPAAGQRGCPGDGRSTGL